MGITKDLRKVLQVGWQGGLPYTKNGPGSVPAVTAPLVTALPAFLRKHGFRSIADLGCGDLSWMRLVDFGDIEYAGYDYIQPPACHLRAYQADVFRPQPYADVALARHLLIHLTNAQVLLFLKAVNAPYLLASNDYRVDNVNRHTLNKHPSYSPLNLMAEPFSLGRIDAIPELVPGQELALVKL